MNQMTKRPLGILRYNAEIMRNNGAPKEVIAKYLSDNGADFKSISAVSTPNEQELARMIESEKSGAFAERQKAFQEASARAEKSKKRQENLEKIQGGVRSFGSGLFLNYGDELESLLTGKDVNQIRREQMEWANKNPELDIALGIAGGMAPALAGFGATGAAGKTLGQRALLGAGAGGGLGVLAGYGAGEGDIANRLESAGLSGLLGAGLGAAVPVATTGISKTGRAINRIVKGLSEEALPAEQVENFILKSGVLQNTPEQALNANILRRASAAGALDIYKPVYNMNATLEAASTMRKPQLMYNPTQQTATAADILSAGRTPQMEQAAQRYADFVASVKDTPGQGLVANEFLKRNPVAKKILAVEPSLKDVPVGSFEWFQKAEKTLNNSLPKNVDTDRLIGRRASIMNAIDDISATREVIHPGTTKANLDYKIGKSWEETGQKTLADRLKFIANMPTETAPALSSKEILSIGFKPYVRGRARELIERGSLKPTDISSTTEKILQSLGFGTGLTLEEQQ